MSCEKVREALPLLPGDENDEAEAVRAHTAECADCRELLEAYEADGRALADCAAARTVPAGLMDGFADAVMAGIERSDRDRPVPPVTPAGAAPATPAGAAPATPAGAAPAGAAPATPAGAAPAGELIRFDGGGLRILLAAAAVALVAAGIALLAQQPLPSETPTGPDRAAATPSEAEATSSDAESTPSDTEATPSDAEATPEPGVELADGELPPLPAPEAGGDRVPMPRRAVRPSRGGNGVLPAAGGARRGGRMNVEELLQRTLPGLERFLRRPVRDDEVRF